MVAGTAGHTLEQDGLTFSIDVRPAALAAPQAARCSRGIVLSLSGRCHVHVIDRCQDHINVLVPTAAAACSLHSCGSWSTIFFDAVVQYSIVGVCRQ